MDGFIEQVQQKNGDTLDKNEKVGNEEASGCVVGLLLRKKLQAVSKEDCPKVNLCQSQEESPRGGQFDLFTDLKDPGKTLSELGLAVPKRRTDGWRNDDYSWGWHRKNDMGDPVGWDDEEEDETEEE